MILRIIRWFRGYVLFIATGRFPERLINLLNKNGIRYWNILPKDNGYSAYMTIKDYRSIRPIARKSSVSLKCKKKIGFPFFVKKYKKRKGLLIGAVCSILIMSILNQFIWVIDVKGTDNISSESILTALKESGLQIGTFKGNLDVRSVVNEATVKLPKVGWMSINALNNVATVEIKEKSSQPVVADDATTCNIKASQDGVITKTIVAKGTCVVKKGTAVARNQLLVSGVVEGKTEDIDLSYVHSSAEIYADVYEDKTFTLDFKSNILIPNKNNTTKSSIDFLCFSTPLKMDFPKQGEAVSLFSTYRFAPNNVVLPLGITEQQQYYFNEESRTVDLNSAKKILLKKIALYESFNYKNNTVKSRSISYTKTSSMLTAKVNYVINKNISKVQKIKVNQ